MIDEDLATLYRAEFPRLAKVLGVAFPAEVAADAVQEAFVEAVRRWSQVGAYEDPAGWVRRVAINKASNSARNRRRQSEIEQTMIVTVSDEDLPANILDLRRALGELPVKMRLAICLHYLGGLKIDEIADVLNVHPGTVKSNLHDGRHRLRTIMEVTSDGQ